MDTLENNELRVTPIKTDSIENGLATISNEGNKQQKFEIDPSKKPLTAEQLKSLLKKPWEFSIHEDRGQLVFAVGSESNPQDEESLMVPDNSRLFLHTHPETSDNTFLSMSDVFTTRKHGSQAQLILVTREGLVIFKRPQYDPVRKCPTDESPNELMATWGKEEGVDFYSGKNGGERKNFFELTSAERIEIARRFCTDTHMIVQEVNWDDSTSVERILNAINLIDTVSDNSVPKIPSILDDVEISIDELPLSHSQRVTLEEAVEHLDAVKLRQGRLFKDRKMRESWRDFAYKLIGEVRGGKVDSRTETLLQKLEEIGSQLNLD